MGYSTAGLAIGLLAPGFVLRSLFSDTSPAVDSLLEGPMPTRRLGQTGFNVSLLALGGQGAIAQPEGRLSSSSESIIGRALDLGVNYIDTSPQYGEGLSEERIGEALKTRRGEVFLATKTYDRSYDGTLRLAEQSLKRLQTDHIDPYQLQDVRLQEDLEGAFSYNGAVRAMERLRAEGTVRFLGITGDYDPTVLLNGIERHPFDTVLMPLNAADIHYRPFQTEPLQTAQRQGIGVMATRVTATNRLFRNDGLNSMEDAMGYVYSFPVSGAVMDVSHLRHLEQNVKIAKRFSEPYDRERLAAIEALTEFYKDDANWFKTW